MLTPEQLAHCADSIVGLYSQLNESIIRDVARRIAKTATVTDTGKLQLRALQNLGVLQQDVLKSVAKYNNMSEEELQKIFADASASAVEYDSKIYRHNGLKTLPLHLSPSAMQILEAGYNKTKGNITNLTRTTAVSTQTKFINACTMAEMKSESGAFSLEQAIFDAVKELASEGATVIYPSGHEDKIDVAVRRNVMTGVGQTTGEICLSYAEELGCDLMEITAHAGARPSHAAWQGKIVSLSGKDGYLSLDDIGYGTGSGFKGWNCRHDWYPYFEGSTRMYSDKELAALEEKNVEFPDGSMHTLYEAEQYQRGLERKIRESKRILAAKDELIKNCSEDLNLGDLQGQFDKYSVKLKSQEAQHRAFCNKTGVQPDGSRTRTIGFSRSTSRKAIGSANRYYRGFSKDYNINNIESLAKYYDVKYNDTQRYNLLKGYMAAVKGKEISPLVGFEFFEQKAQSVSQQLVGISNSCDIEVKGVTPHFVARVIGQTSTSHAGMRLGTKPEHIIDTLNHPENISQPYFVETKSTNGKKFMDKRITITGEKSQVVFSLTEQVFVTAIPF